MLEEWTEEQIQQFLSSQPGARRLGDDPGRSKVIELPTRLSGRFVFVYTPLCGTCIAARRMLEVAAAMDADRRISACNINLTRRLAADWKIESVPCLVYLSRGRVAARRYRMNSVQDLVAWMHRAEQGLEASDAPEASDTLENP